MCISFFSTEFTARYPTLVAFNRDEFLERETLLPHWWEGEDIALYGGKDVKAGGSWLAVSKCGRVAFLTNFREKTQGNDGEKRSRGLLVKNYLTGESSPKDYCEEVKEGDYNGYNLVVGHLCRKGFAHVSNRGSNKKTVKAIEGAGVFGTSNGCFGDWWKVRRGCTKIEEHLESLRQSTNPQLVANWIFDNVLLDDEKAPREELPMTGLGEDIEMPNSSIYVKPFSRAYFDGTFGTRSSTVILFDSAENKALWFERRPGCKSATLESFNLS